MPCRFKAVFVALIAMGAFLFAPLTPAAADPEPAALPTSLPLPPLPVQATFGMERPPRLKDPKINQMMPSLVRRDFLEDSLVALKLAPLEWPVYGQVSSGFGMRKLGELTRVHEGIDIPVPLGTPIKAARRGVVAEACLYNGYGKTVVLDHGQGVKTLYAHCSRLLVKKGEHIEAGAVIAVAGGTGRSTATHLHFGVMIAGRFRDPATFLKNISPQLAQKW